MSRRGSGHSREQKSGSNTMDDKAVNTTDDLLLCSKCHGRIRGGEHRIMLKEYINSIEYINSCHSLLNQIVSKQKCDHTFTLPDIPNFVNVFSIVYNQFQKKKKRKPVHELDNIESLDEIYSRIESMDVSEVKHRGNTTDSEAETKKNSATFRRRVRKSETSDGENVSVMNSNKKIVRNSSIPRPVSSEKMRRVDDDSHRAGGRLHRQEHRGKPVNPQKLSRHELSKAVLERSKHSGEISEEDLDKYAKDLLRSRSESPSTPRSLSSNSASPSPRNRKLNIRVPSRMKLRTGAGTKMSTRVQPKLSPTINESINNLENKSEQQESPGTSDSKIKSQPSNHSADSKRRQFEENTELSQQPVCEENEVEVDSNQNNSISPKASLKMKQSDHSDHQYVVKQKPNDFFTQRRRIISDIINKPLFPDSDVDTDKEVKAYNSESDIDDDVFEKKSVKSTKSSKGGEVNNTYNLLKMSISRPLSNSVLSNIGILTHSGKIKAEKEQELNRLKNHLSKDKQSSAFRQPRNKPRESQHHHGKTAAASLLGNMSSPSSEIKSDEEEVSTQQMDGHGHYHHRRNHY